MLDATDCSFGVLAEVRHGTTGQPYLQSHAVTDIYRPGYEKTDVLSNLQFHNLQTLNGAIMTELRPVITNAPAVDPRSGGLPHGHEKLDSYCGLPVLYNGELTGAVALGNKINGFPSGYEHELSPVCELAALIIADSRGLLS